MQRSSGDALTTLLRTRLMRLLVRQPAPRLLQVADWLSEHPLCAASVRPLGWWLSRGEVKVAGGLGVGLRLSAAHLPLYHLHAHALIHGALEVPVQEAMRRHLGPGGVFYDIGANLGFFTLAGARLAGPTGAIVAFDPNPANAAAIRENAAANGFEAIVTVREAAVAECSRRGLLHIPFDSVWGQLDSVGAHPDTRTTREVDVVSIDHLLESGSIPAPSVVKIDVEGAELAVLAGMARTLERHSPVVICELHGTNSEFVDLMERHGYQVTNLDGTEAVRDASPHAHVLGLRRAGVGLKEAPGPR